MSAMEILSPAGHVLAGAAGGGAAGLVGSGGDVKSAAQGALTGGLMGWAGTIGGFGVEGANSAARYAAHATAGCIGGAVDGSGCGRGAASAVVGKFATNMSEGIHPAGQFTIAVVAGGTTSVITGGKFANGARTAAYGYLFNYLAHVHKDLTYRASRMAGLNPLASDLLSGATVMVDFQGPRFGGDLGIEFSAQDVEHSHMHAMCAGSSSAALCDLKITDYRERMWNMKSMAGLAGLLHLYQDSFAPGHANQQPYNGSIGWDHIKGDMSPPPALANQIIQGSAEIIKNYMSYWQCGPK